MKGAAPLGIDKAFTAVPLLRSPQEKVTVTLEKENVSASLWAFAFFNPETTTFLLSCLTTNCSSGMLGIGPTPPPSSARNFYTPREVHVGPAPAMT